MKISPVGISLALLVVSMYFGTVPTALAGPDITPPSLTSVTISSDGAGGVWARAGDTVTLTFTSDENIMTPVVTIGGRAAVEAGAGTAWTATRVIDGTETEGTDVFTIDFTDLAGNAGTQVTAITMGGSVTIDVTVPMVTSAAITAGNTATIVYDELVISTIGDYSNLVIGVARGITVHGGSGTTTITLTFDMAAAAVDAVGIIDIGVDLTDLAGNPIAPVSQGLTDGQAPSLTSVTISSDGAGGVWARAGDTVTLTFTSDENIMTPVVTIGGRAAVEAGAGTAWTATRVIDGTETEGTDVFTIDFTDTPAGNAGTQVTAITMGGSVTIDVTVPTLNPVTISSDGAGGVWAVVTDTVTLTFTSDENIMTPVVTIGGRAAVEAGAGTAWTATRVIDGTETEGTDVFTIDFTDLAGNAGTQVTAITMGGSVTIDVTVPMVTAGAVIAANRFAILYDEPVISVSGDYTNLMIGAASPAVTMSTTDSATIVVTFNTPPMPSPDDTGMVDIGVGLTDLAGNPIAPVSQGLTDGQAPSLTSVTISSDGAGGVWARAGDTVTLTFTSDENIMTPVVTIGGRAAVEAGAGTAWTATRVIDGTETEGTDVFTIDFTDTPAGNAGTQVTAITMGGSVTIDVTAPTVTSSEITSDSEVTIVYDEPVITAIGDYSTLFIVTQGANIISFAFGSPDTIILSFGLVLAEADDIGRITIGAGVTDRAGNIINMPGVYNLSDGQVARESHTSVGSGSAPSFSTPSFGAASSDSSITMSPISINGKHYNFIQSGNLIPAGTIPLEDDVSEESETVEQITNVIKVGQLTQLKFVTYTNLGADHIQHAAIYTNLKGTSVNPLSDTIGVIYDKGKELEILDRNNILSEAVIKISGEGNRVDVIANFIFSKNMETSDLVLKMWDENRYPLYAHIEDAWKVEGETISEELSLIEEPIIEIDSEKTVSAIKKWAGYDLEIVSDSQMLNTIGINGDFIPKWFKKSAKWIVNEQISLEEFVEALRFVHKINA